MKYAACIEYDGTAYFGWQRLSHGPSVQAEIEQSLLSEKLNLEDSIRDNIRSLILMRVGEFDYDKKMGFEIWNFDNEVFYHEKEPYYEKQKKELQESEQKREKQTLIYTVVGTFTLLLSVFIFIIEC